MQEVQNAKPKQTSNSILRCSDSDDDSDRSGRRSSCQRSASAKNCRKIEDDKANVLKVNIPRNDLRLNTWAAFFGTDKDAAVAGDIAMLESEVTHAQGTPKPRSGCGRDPPSHDKHTTDDHLPSLLGAGTCG